MNKKIIISVFLALACLLPGVKAQMNITVINTNEVLKAQSIDDVLFTVQYEMTFVPDTLNPEKTENETMVLKAGKKSSVFYSYAKYLTDSIIEIDKRTGASMDVITNHLKQYNSKIGYRVYKNHPEGKITYQDQLAVNRFLCEEKNESPRWTLLSDTATILSYPCQKAVTTFRGRKYEVWYTMEIPRSEGPWKLHGLPGLILKAEDMQKHYVFECTGITQNRSEEDKIMFSSEGYQTISRKELNKMYTRYAADPIGYVTASAPNVTVKMAGEDGSPAKNPKNTPYNPIERE